MRRPSRQIEVFDISLMAVVTKAMGAFLVLFVLVLPHYTSDPDVVKTSAEAREQLAKMREEIEDLARQVGANPADTAALQAEIRRLREALSESDYKVDQLSKQASALSSQLRSARDDLEKTKAQLDAAEALRRQAQTAEAEMEVAANQAQQARRAALVAEAELEQKANQVLQAQRRTLIAQAEGEQNENALMAVAERTTLKPKLLLLYHWTIEPNCANIGLDVGMINIDGQAMPGGLSLRHLGDSGKALTERSDAVTAAFPLGTYIAGQPRHAFSVRALWRSEQLRALTYAHIERPATQVCHIDLETTIYNLETNSYRDLEQRTFEVPASAQLILLNGIDFSQSSSRISAPTPPDQTLWNSKKVEIQRSSYAPAKLAP